MVSPDDARTKAAATYNAAADYFDDEINSFWDRFGRRTVERLHLERGHRVLDVCCGSGASAIPAAEVVGPRGSVLGVDLAENLLDLARAKAAKRGMTHVEFRIGDLLDLGQPEGSFDAVICVFGIFFVPDMEAAVRALWRLVAPGGALAITTWGPRFFEPASSFFWDAVHAVRPDLVHGFNPWDRISEPDAVRDLLVASGVTAPAVVLETGAQPLRSPTDWWSMVLGTGYRGTIEAMDVVAREEVRRRNLIAIQEAGVTEVEANVVYAIARM